MSSSNTAITITSHLNNDAFLTMVGRQTLFRLKWHFINGGDNMCLFQMDYKITFYLVKALLREYMHRIEWLQRDKWA